jgi:hypothetical protein
MLDPKNHLLFSSDLLSGYEKNHKLNFGHLLMTVNYRVPRPTQNSLAAMQVGSSE